MVAIAKNTRLKKTEPVLRTRLDMERCVGENARMQIERDAVLMEMDGEIQVIRARYEENINGLTADLESEMTIAKEWAEANPSEFGALKSIEFIHGIAGFRTGMPKLKTLSKFTWDRVLSQAWRATMENNGVCS